MIMPNATWTTFYRRLCEVQYAWILEMHDMMDIIPHGCSSIGLLASLGRESAGA